MRREPHEDAEQVTQLLRGEPVRIQKVCGGWAAIRTEYGYPGWVRERAIAGPPIGGPWPIALGDDVLAEARAYLGAPYEWGGMSARGIDCSGLVHMAFRRVGVLIPRDSWQQETAGQEIAEDELRSGDLLCYPEHVAFWVGPGWILHASGRAGVRAVLEEREPTALAAQRRGCRRFETGVTR